jgi:adenosylcobinamide-GDP ribazoletransferase
MRSFLAAIQFLTIIPIRLKRLSEKEIAFAQAYFPAAGFLIGVCLAGTQVLCNALGYSKLSVDILLVVALAFLTGALHLDGIADTFDALASRKDRESMLSIMRDPHTGAGGVVAVTCVLMAKTAFLFRIPSGIEVVVLILVCVLSRWQLVLLMRAFPYARAQGKASGFVKGGGCSVVILSTILAVLCAWGLFVWPGLVLLVSAGACAAAFGAYAGKKFGGITGDILGAAVELTELFLLFMAPIVTAGFV